MGQCRNRKTPLFYAKWISPADISYYYVKFYDPYSDEYYLSKIANSFAQPFENLCKSLENFVLKTSGS